MFDTTESGIPQFYREAATLEPTEAEVSRVLRELAGRAAKHRARGRRYGVVALAFAIVALGAAFSYAPIGALDDFFAGGAVPGTRVDAGSLPTWLENGTNLPASHPQQGSERLLAEQDGQRLLAYRDATTGRACLAFDRDSDTCSTNAAWHKQFGRHALLKLASGVGPTRDGKVAVFGLARSSVVRVELLDGNTVAAKAPVTNGGWVIVAAQGRHDTLVGLDRNGEPVETLPARSWTWSFCTQEAGCP
jgi:hypothetical protein